ncbi:hypothetical protein AOLI_G00146750 [Acnodon oligacanthus]
MSCLLFWCCRGRQSESDTETNANEEQLSRDGGKIKRKKRWRLRKRKGQQKKEMTVDVKRAEEIQTAQHTAAGEKGSDVPHLPAGIVSGSLEKISAGTPQKMEIPIHEDFQSTKDIPEASNDLSGNLPDQIKAEVEAAAIKPLMSADLDEEADNNQPLELMNIYLDESEETAEKHLGDEVIATEVEADVEEKSDAESDWMFDYVPIKSWADFMEETEGTIDQSDEIEELKNDFPVNEVKPDK